MILKMRSRRLDRAVNTLLATLVVIASAATLLAGEKRQWTDSTGAFSIEAEFVSESSGKVTLRTADGGELEIELKLLSQKDQEYVTKLNAADNPFKPKTDSPFKPRSTPTAPMKTSDEPSARKGVVDDSGSFESRLVTVNTAAATPVSMATDRDGWELTPPAGQPVAASGRRGPISLPPKTGFHESLTRLVINRSGTHAVIGYQLSFPRDTETTRLVLCDLESGRTLANRETGGLLQPLALSDDGATVVMARNEFGFGKHDRLETWTITPSAIQKGVAWIPYGEGGDVNWAEFLPDGSLVTSGEERVIAWRLPELAPLWFASHSKGCTPAVSADGRLLVLATKEQLSVIDVQTQETIASREAPSGAFPKLAFSVSGNRIGCATMEGVTVWDTATGETSRELDYAGLPAIGPPTAPIFSGDDYLLIGHRFLIDLPSQIRLWEYDRAGAVTGYGGLCWFVAADGDKRPGVLFGANLPHPPVLDALAKAQADPNYFVVKPGSSIKLNLNGLSDATQRDKVRQSLTERLQAKEISVDDSAAVELVASFDPPKEKNIIYHGFGGMQAVDFQETVSRIKIVHAGQTLWETQGSNQPFSISRSDGEDLQQAIKKYEKPSYAFFERVDLPRMLARPNEQKSAALGRSTVTTSGIR